MQRNTMKSKILDGELVFGLGLDVPDPIMVEYAAIAGLDFVRFDLEQGPYSLEGLEHAVRAAEAAGVTPTARLDGVHPEFVHQVLNRGVAGLTFPHVHSAADAVAAVRAAKFGPEGDRTVSAPPGKGMFARWALNIDAEDIYAFANRETLVVCLIESVEGMKNVEDIAAVPGVDVITFGSGDLSASLGLTGQFEHAEVRDLIRDGIARARAVGKPVGISIGARSTERVQEYIDLGVRVLQFLPAPVIVDAITAAKAELRISSSD